MLKLIFITFVTAVVLQAVVSYANPIASAPQEEQSSGRSHVVADSTDDVAQSATQNFEAAVTAASHELVFNDNAEEATEGPNDIADFENDDDDDEDDDDDLGEDEDEGEEDDDDDDEKRRPSLLYSLLDYFDIKVPFISRANDDDDDDDYDFDEDFDDDGYFYDEDSFHSVGESLQYKPDGTRRVVDKVVPIDSEELDFGKVVVNLNFVQLGDKVTESDSDAVEGVTKEPPLNGDRALSAASVEDSEEIDEVTEPQPLFEVYRFGNSSHETLNTTSGF